MGLDMYLSKKIYLGANYEHNNVKGKIELTQGKDNKPVIINPNKVTYIIEAAAYWRKANQIHRWFVEKVQDGTDDCGYYYVEQAQLKELISDCKKVLENKDKAAELMPSANGFFFGGTDYDEWYFKDIEDTIKQLEEALTDESAEFEYHSSW